MAKKSQKNAVPAENASDNFSSSSEDFSDLEEGQVSSKPAEKKGHKVQLQKTKPADAPFQAKKRAVIFLGNLPKSFQEREMRKYFSQFGELLKVRLARDHRSGASKKHGWIEFADLATARTAKETMNNYLMLGQIMKVDLVEQPPANLFPANFRENFKEFDWRSVEYKKETAPKPLEEWKALQALYESERSSHMDHLKKLGFEYQLGAQTSKAKVSKTKKKAKK